MFKIIDVNKRHFSKNTFPSQIGTSIFQELKPVFVTKTNGLTGIENGNHLKDFQRTRVILIDPLIL